MSFINSYGKAPFSAIFLPSSDIEIALGEIWAAADAIRF